MNRLFFRRQISIGLALALIVALAAFFARTASAQQPTAAGDTTVRLTLGEAVRMAARQNAAVEGARTRVDAAEARVTQRRSDLLPNLSAAVSERGSTIDDEGGWSKVNDDLFDPDKGSITKIENDAGVSTGK